MSINTAKEFQLPTKSFYNGIINFCSAVARAHHRWYTLRTVRSKTLTPSDSVVSCFRSFLETVRVNFDALATRKLEVLATLEMSHPEGYSRALSRLKRAEGDPMKGKEYKKVRHKYALRVWVRYIHKCLLSSSVIDPQWLCCSFIIVMLFKICFIHIDERIRKEFLEYMKYMWWVCKQCKIHTV